MLQHWIVGDDYQHRGGGFMGRSWDSFVPGPVYWREALRVLKPGGHLVAFGGTRTYDLLVIAARLAGFQVRDTLVWLHGQGFPKSLDVGKAIDKAAGVEREVLSKGKPLKRLIPGADQNRTGSWIKDNGREFVPTETAPATAAAAEWEGWGTALKPAMEPIVLARKPLTGSVAANVLEHGTGALNVEGCRLPTTENLNGGTYSAGGNKSPLPGDDRSAKGQGMFVEGGGRLPGEYEQPSGRWPANVLLDPEAAALLDEQSGERRSAGDYMKGNGVQGPKVGPASIPIDGLTSATYADGGGASRFFYCAKTSAGERNAGLDGFEALVSPTMNGGIGGKPHEQVCVCESPELGRDASKCARCGGVYDAGDAVAPKRNTHPTVKPIALMRWLCRLVTPPGGVVLDPFCGSGSTGCAAVLEGLRFIGCEQGDPPGDPRFGQIARARIGWWAEHPEGVSLIDRLAAEREREAVAAAGQDALF